MFIDKQTYRIVFKERKKDKQTKKVSIDKQTNRIVLTDRKTDRQTNRMKISDPLGKVYSHTMFRRRSYDMQEGNTDEVTTTPTPDPGPTPPPPLPPHINRGGYFDARNRSR